jgi:hypothetical protein
MTLENHLQCVGCGWSPIATKSQTWEATNAWKLLFVDNAIKTYSSRTPIIIFNPNCQTRVMFWFVQYWDSFIPRFQIRFVLQHLFSQPKFYSQHFLTDSFGFALEREYLEVDVDIQFEIYLDLEEISDVFTKIITVVPDRPSLS